MRRRCCEAVFARRWSGLPDEQCVSCRRGNESALAASPFFTGIRFSHVRVDLPLHGAASDGVNFATAWLLAGPRGKTSKTAPRQIERLWKRPAEAHRAARSDSVSRRSAVHQAVSGGATILMCWNGFLTSTRRFPCARRRSPASGAWAREIDRLAWGMPVRWRARAISGPWATRQHRAGVSPSSGPGWAGVRDLSADAFKWLGAGN